MPLYPGRLHWCSPTPAFSPALGFYDGYGPSGARQSFASPARLLLGRILTNAWSIRAANSSTLTGRDEVEQSPLELIVIRVFGLDIILSAVFCLLLELIGIQVHLLGCTKRNSRNEIVWQNIFRTANIPLG